MTKSGHKGNDISLEIFELSHKRKSAQRTSKKKSTKSNKNSQNYRQQEEGLKEKETELTQNTRSPKQTQENPSQKRPTPKKKDKNLHSATADLEKLPPTANRIRSPQRKNQDNRKTKHPRKIPHAANKKSPRKTSVNQRTDRKQNQNPDSLTIEVTQTKENLEAEKNPNTTKKKACSKEVNTLETEKKETDTKCTDKTGEVAAKNRDVENSAKKKPNESKKKSNKEKNNC